MNSATSSSAACPDAADADADFEVDDAEADADALADAEADDEADALAEDDCPLHPARAPAASAATSAAAMQMVVRFMLLFSNPFVDGQSIPPRRPSLFGASARQKAKTRIGGTALEGKMLLENLVALWVYVAALVCAALNMHVSRNIFEPKTRKME